jgi:MFS family permease
MEATRAVEPPQTRRSDINLLYAARCVRGFGDGYAAVILPAWLTAIGFTPAQVGLAATASLLGTAVFTLGVGLIAPRHDLRNMMVFGAALMALTGVALPAYDYLAWIAVVLFIGTINPSTGDLGVLVPLEHAMLASAPASLRATASPAPCRWRWARSRPGSRMLRWRGA